MGHTEVSSLTDLRMRERQSRLPGASAGSRVPAGGNRSSISPGGPWVRAGALAVSAILHLAVAAALVRPADRAAGSPPTVLEVSIVDGVPGHGSPSREATHDEASDVAQAWPAPSRPDPARTAPQTSPLRAAHASAASADRVLAASTRSASAARMPARPARPVSTGAARAQTPVGIVPPPSGPSRPQSGAPPAAMRQLADAGPAAQTGGGAAHWPGAAAGRNGVRGPQALPGNPLPVYPRLARVHDQEGRVVLGVRVLPSGAVDTVRVERSSGFALLDEAALAAVRRWRFAPALRSGSPVPASLRVPVRFVLTE